MNSKIRYYYKNNLINQMFFQFKCLLFPPTASHTQGSKYSFTIADYEGPQGAFECLQQNQGQLEILGSLPHKLRIHANEDVYEATKHRMAVVQENQSNKW
jgi:RNA polymerase II elongation factor ELL